MIAKQYTVLEVSNGSKTYFTLNAPLELKHKGLIQNRIRDSLPHELKYVESDEWERIYDHSFTLLNVAALQGTTPNLENVGLESTIVTVTDGNLKTIGPVHPLIALETLGISLRDKILYIEA